MKSRYANYPITYFYLQVFSINSTPKYLNKSTCHIFLSYIFMLTSEFLFLITITIISFYLLSYLFLFLICSPSLSYLPEVYLHFQSMSLGHLRKHMSPQLQSLLSAAVTLEISWHSLHVPHYCWISYYSEFARVSYVPAQLYLCNLHTFVTERFTSITWTRSCIHCETKLA